MVFWRLPPQDTASSTSAAAATKCLAGTPTSIDQYVGPCYESSVIGAEIKCKLADLFYFAPTPDRNGGDELRVLFGIVQQREIHFRCARAGTDCDDADAFRSQLESKRAREPEQARFARRIGRASGQRNMAHDGRHVDDSSVTLAFHVRDQRSAQEKRAAQVGGDDAVPFRERKFRDVLANVDPRIVDQ